MPTAHELLLCMTHFWRLDSKYVKWSFYRSVLLFISHLIMFSEALHQAVARVQGVDAWMVRAAPFTILRYWEDGERRVDWDTPESQRFSCKVEVGNGKSKQNYLQNKSTPYSACQPTTTLLLFIWLVLGSFELD